MPGFSKGSRKSIVESNKRRKGETRSQEFKNNRSGEKNPNYGGKSFTEVTHEKMKKNHVKELTSEWKANISASLIGNTRTLGKTWKLGEEQRRHISEGKKGRKCMTNGHGYIRVHPDDINYYLSKGYVFGMKLKEKSNE